MLGQVLALTLLLLIKGHQGQGKEAQPGRGGLAWTRSCGLQGNQDVSLRIVLLTWSPEPVTRSSSLQLWAGWVRQQRLAVGWEVFEKCASGHAINNPGHLGKVSPSHQLQFSFLSRGGESVLSAGCKNEISSHLVQLPKERRSGHELSQRKSSGSEAQRLTDYSLRQES